MLYDETFLKDLSRQKDRTIFARITALDNEEHVLTELQGEVTGGNINIDGKSAVRRTCSLSMVSKTLTINEYSWSLENKFHLDIGITNLINSNYEDIIWFSQGTYIITQFSYSMNTNSCNINLSGKDKMCLLNGEIGGSFNSEIDFGIIEEIDKVNKTKTLHHVLIKDIIKEMVHEYAHEPFHNIIINDLDDTGLELQEYRYDKPLYIWMRKGSNIYENGSLDAKKNCWVDDKKILISEIEHYYPLMKNEEITIQPTEVRLAENDETIYYVSKISFGDTAGYTETDLTYPGDLIAKPGQTVTSVLDKIKTMLNNYEYYYNINGQFIFQKKQRVPKDSDFTFGSTDIISSFGNSPDLKNIKNDFCVWGKRKGITGSDLPIHYRYAIDVKPKLYNTLEITQEDADKYNKIFGTHIKPKKSITYKASKNAKFEEGCYDWRELIYQMALDYRLCNHFDDFELRVKNANPHFPTGYTGYEQYYIDLEGFWRQLYDPSQNSAAEDEQKKIIADLTKELDALKEKPDDNRQAINELEEKIREEERTLVNIQSYYHEGDLIYWNKAVTDTPENLNFFFDFLDTDGDMNKYSNRAISNRPKVVNNDKVKSIFNREVPTVIFYKEGEEQIGEKTGYTYFNVAGYDNLFSISALGRSAWDQMEELLDTHTYFNESINITALPIYYLEPNVSVYVNNLDTNMIGYYIVNRISIPLTYNGMTSLNITKDLRRLEG